MRRVLCCLLMALVFLACGSKEARRDGFFENGLKYETDGRYDEARLEAKNVIKLDPNHVGAYLLLARCALKAQNWQEAFAGFQRATELDPTNVEGLLGQGRLYLLSGDTAKAEASAGQILALDASSLDARLLRAGAMLRAGRYDEAREQLGEVFSRDPVNEDAFLALSVVHAEQGRLDEARVLVDKGLAALPDSRALHFRAATLAAEQQDFGPAEAHLHRLRDLDADNRGVMLLLASLYERMGSSDRVEGILRDLLNAEPESEAARLRLVEHLLRTGKSDQALAIVDGTEMSPKLRLARAAALAALKRPGEAEQVLASVADDPDAGPAGIDALLRLSELKLRRADSAGALVLVDEALRKNPGDVRGHAARGRILLIMGRHDQALGELRIALHESPADAGLAILLAKAQVAAGNALSAVETLRAALELNPVSEELRLELAEIHERQGDLDAALGVLQNAAAHGDMSPRLLCAMGDIEARRAGYDLAEVYFRQAAETEQARPAALMRIAALQAARKEWNAARATLGDVLRDAPGARGPASLMVRLEMQTGGPEAALDWARAWSDSRPSDAAAADFLGLTAMRFKKYAQAEAAFAEAARRDPESTLPAMRLASLKAAMGKREEAMADCRAALAKAPDSVPESLLLGQLLQLGGEHAEAEKIYRRLLELYPHQRMLNNNLAYSIVSDSSATSERLAEALALAEKAAATGDPAAADTLGWIHYRLGDRQAALEHLRRAHEALPDDPSVTYHLARVLAEDGHKTEARELLEGLLGRTKEFPEYAAARELLKSEW